MKRYLILILLCAFSALFGISEQFIQLKLAGLRHTVRGPLSEKSFDAYVKAMHEEGDKLGYRYADVLKGCIDEASKKIEYYQDIKKHGQSYRVSRPVLTIAAVSSLVAGIGFWILRDYNRTIEQLDRKGITVKDYSNDQVLYSGYADSEAEGLLRKLTVVNPYGAFLPIVIGVPGALLFGMAGGTAVYRETLDRIYCDTFHKRYCFVKKHLERHLAQI